MTLAYTAYKVLSTSAFAVAFPPFWLFTRVTGRHAEGLPHRLGRYPRSLFSPMPEHRRVWFHAASVGEVSVAAAVIDALGRTLPDWSVVLSTTTDQGQKVAREALGHRVACIYAPVDFSGAVNRALDVVRPRALVCMETEIWPNWLQAAHRRGIRTALVNGRISIRSIRGYLRVRPLMRTVLAGVDAFSMIGEEDAGRIRSIGAPAGRVVVNGNAKFDRLARATDPSVQRAMARLFGLDRDTPVFVAGSTRGREPAMVLHAFDRIRRRFPDALMVIAPRHLERVGSIVEQVRGHGLDCQLRTALSPPQACRTAPVVILDTVGELPAAYSIATIVFCGGSLVPLGGQNILEAAAWGKPVLYGPSMEDFADARTLLESSGGGMAVADTDALAREALACLADPGRASAMGRAGEAAVRSCTGAADRHAAVVRRLLE
jgi:3-deoxy-D-manno-octulosonic-acid transferase